ALGSSHGIHSRFSPRAAPDPPGRQRRPAADTLDRFLPPYPGHPAHALGGSLGGGRGARVHRQLVRDPLHGPVTRRSAQLLGGVPEGLRNFAALAIRIETQTYGYVLLLTDRYPSFNVGIEA